jgi:hypothetical protein
MLPVNIKEKEFYHGTIIAIFWPSDKSYRPANSVLKDHKAQKLCLYNSQNYLA